MASKRDRHSAATPHAEPLPQLLTSEAARLVGISADTLRRWSNAGRLTVRRTSSGIRLYSRSELERLAAARLRGSPATREEAEAPSR
jgi:excisionase family DNA binding protein